jgi:protein O-GlcNAc transferase
MNSARKFKRKNKKQSKIRIDKLFLQASTMQNNGQLNSAKNIYRKILNSQPKHIDTLHALGIIYFSQEDYSSANKYLKKCLEIKADHFPALNSIGVLYKNKNLFSEAIASFEKALEQNPESAATVNNLANVYKARGNIDAAIEHYKKALEISPELSEAHNNIGNIYRKIGLYQEAVNHLQTAIKQKPDNWKFYNNLAICYLKHGKISQSLIHCRKAIELNPNYAIAWNNLGNILKEQGEISQAIKAYEKSLHLAGDFTKASSNLLLCKNYIKTDPQDFYQEHCVLAKSFSSSFLPEITETKSSKSSPPKEINTRIGYLSGDFRHHPVASFIEPILENHDPEKFTIFCYSNTEQPDKITERLQKLAIWRDIVSLNDQQAYELIQKDNIDILVDLSGHTHGNRLALMGRKPAPVQVTYLGYPNSTGLAEVDYRLTDKIADPEDQQAYYSEKLIRLASGFLCYKPIAKHPEPKCLRQKKSITLGSFNNLAKLSDKVINSWAAILSQLPQAKIILKNRSLQDSSARNILLEKFENSGLLNPEKRVKLYGFLPDPGQHLQLYEQIDIALDTFPYNGTTTTCEALWMGCPVITILGDTHRARVSASILTQIGAENLITANRDEYIKKTVQLAGNKTELEKYKKELRTRMLSSTLMDGARFCRILEETFKKIIKP